MRGATTATKIQRYRTLDQNTYTCLATFPCISLPFAFALLTHKNAGLVIVPSPAVLHACETVFV